MMNLHTRPASRPRLRFVTLKYICFGANVIIFVYLYYFANCVCCLYNSCTIYVYYLRSWVPLPRPKLQKSCRNLLSAVAEVVEAELGFCGA
jgi:hypothetical protein